MNDWGHADRARGLAHASSEFVGFFNDDDSYDLTYVEKMLTAADKADVVYCAWNEIPDCVFQTCSSTAGNFIVRTELARKAGYNGRDYIADGHFIEAIKTLDPRIVKVDEVLYRHNEVI